MIQDSKKLIAFLEYENRNNIRDEDIELMKNNFEFYDAFNTYVVNFHYDPIYYILNARYRKKPDSQGHSEKDGLYSIENYLEEDVIVTMTYFDYIGERIYKCIQGEEGAFADPNILKKFLYGIKKYFENEDIELNHVNILPELEKLILLCDIAIKYKYKIDFFDEEWV